MNGNSCKARLYGVQIYEEGTLVRDYVPICQGGTYALLDKVQNWKEPARRGRRVYNDQEFVASLRDQYARRSSLSPRQVLALRRVCVTYRDQIPEFEEVADRLGLRDLPAHEKAAKAEADAKADARAERRAKSRRRSRR